MKNLRYLIAALTAIVCVTLAMSSCDPKQEPTPGPDTTGVDTTGNTPNPDPQPFQSILELDANGELTAIPFPCVDWLGGEKAVQAFEHSKGATLDKTIDKNGKKVLSYKTGDPKGQQPIRLYIIDPAKATLETSSIQITSKLVAEGDDINDNMEILLSDAGYQKVPEAKGIAYSNGTYLLVFSKVNESSWAIAYKSAGDPAQLAGILQVKDFPYLKKETKMSTYTFEEIEAYEKQLGLRKQTKKTDTYVIYQAIDPSKVNLSYVRYEINPDDEKTSGPIVRTDRFTMAMYRQPELRSYFELNGFTYEGAFQIYAQKFVNKDLAVRLRLSDKRPGSIVVFEDAPDLYHKEPTPEKPTFQALYMPLLDVFGQKISKDSPIIAREKELHPDCDVTFKPANPDAGYKYDAIKVDMPLSFKLDPADRNKPRTISYSYESLSGSIIEQISYNFSKEWEDAKIDGDNTIIKDFMTKNGFAYKGDQILENEQGQLHLYQYYNASLGIYFEYVRFIKPAFMTLPIGIYTKTPTVQL